jgi:hypothetical protein
VADVTIDAAGNNFSARSVRSTVYTTVLIGYHFYIDADNDFYYRKTTDGGATWGSAVSVFTGSADAFGVWFDQWTPGNSGTLIYTWYVEQGTDDVRFRTLDTSGDTLGTEATVYAGSSVAAGRSVHVSGAKMRGGNLICVFDIDDSTESGTYRSTDGGGTWGARTNVIEAVGDIAMVFPGNESDTQDAWILYHDSSAEELTLKVHDDSADTNSESSPITHTDLAADLTGPFGFSAAIRHSDRHLILVHVNAYDAGTGDGECWDINGTGSITQKGDFFTNADDCYYPTVYVSPTNHIYVAYIGKTDGSETLGTSVGVYYKRSTDGGTTWGSETPYSASNGDYRTTYVPLNGPLFAVTWRNHTTGAQITNADNTVEPSAGMMQIIFCG